MKEDRQKVKQGLNWLAWYLDSSIALPGLGAPKAILANLAFNIPIDTAVGALPIFEDIFDLSWKAIQRHARILGECQEPPLKTVVSSRLFAWGWWSRFGPRHKGQPAHLLAGSYSLACHQ